MGNGAVVSSASAGGASSCSEWFNRSLRCCAEDDHVSLGATWAQNFGNCPLDDSQWGKLFATAAAHGALGCLEFLFQCMDSEASALKGASSSKKLQKLVGALTAQSAAAAAQPEALDLVISVFGKKVLKGEHVDESGALPIHLASGAASSNGTDSSHQYPSANRYRQAWDHDKEARAVACVSTLAATCPSTLRVATRDGSLPLHVAARAGSQAVCAELIANGADVEAMNLRTGQYCWQVAGESALVKWLQAARTSPHGAASSSNGNTRARNKRPARTPEEEMERAMMIWNVFFENAAKRSFAPTPSSVPPLRNTDGRSSSTAHSQSARSDYGRQNVSKYTSKANTARAASARGSTTDMDEYRRLRADLFGMDSLSLSPESSSKEKRRKGDYKHSKQRDYANNSSDNDNSGGGKWQWEILHDNALTSTQANTAKKSNHSPLWVACESEEGTWYWFDASEDSQGSSHRSGWTGGVGVEEGFSAHVGAYSSTITTMPTTWEEPLEWASNPWEMRWDDDSNAWFYANDLTGGATWELPNASAAQMQHARAGREEVAIDENVNQGWEACWDESEEAWYWYETATGESQWADDGTILDEADNSRKAAAAAAAAASDEWETCWDEESEAWYFANATSGEVRWAEAEDFE